MRRLRERLRKVDWVAVGETLGGLILMLALAGWLLGGSTDGACWQWMCP